MTIHYDLYQPGTSWLHRLDPRSKMLIVACCSTCLLIMHNVWLLLGALCLTQAGLAIARVDPAKRAWVWKMLAPTMLMIAALWVIFYRGEGPLLFRLWFVQVTAINLAQGIAMALRIAALAFIIFLWLFTTDQGALVRGIVALGIPYTWGLTLAMALRYLPTMAGIFSMILEAQQARALDLESGGLIKRVRAYVPITVAMVITALRTADHLSRALESRALGAATPRTYLRALSLSRRDCVVSLAVVITTGLFLWARFALGVGVHPLHLWT